MCAQCHCGPDELRARRTSWRARAVTNSPTSSHEEGVGVICYSLLSSGRTGARKDFFSPWRRFSSSSRSLVRRERFLFWRRILAMRSASAILLPVIFASILSSSSRQAHQLGLERNSLRARYVEIFDWPKLQALANRFLNMRLPRMAPKIICR